MYMKTLNTITKLPSLFILACIISIVASSVKAGHHELKLDRDPETKVVLSGYDAVSYFVDMKAKKGSPKIQTEWMGAVWNFSSEKNRELFLANPEKYIPEYGGRCAISIKNGKSEVANPACFVIEAERLYLLASPKLADRLQTNFAKNIKKANKNWDFLKDQIEFK